MGFNKCVLPTINILKEELNRVGLDEFINRYKTYDCIMGEINSVDFLNTKIKQYYGVTDSGDGRVPS
jgi:hypothetical protein